MFIERLMVALDGGNKCDKSTILRSLIKIIGLYQGHPRQRKERYIHWSRDKFAKCKYSYVIFLRMSIPGNINILGISKHKTEIISQGQKRLILKV